MYAPRDRLKMLSDSKFLMCCGKRIYSEEVGYENDHVIRPATKNDVSCEFDRSVKLMDALNAGRVFLLV